MPITLGGKQYKDFKTGVKALKSRRPDIKDPKAYVATVERTIEKRRKAKRGK